MVRPRNTQSEAGDYFHEITASFNMFKTRGGQGTGLTTSLHLKCHILCPTWPDILWIFKPDIMCSCVSIICTCIMCIDDPNIGVLYKSEDTF